VRNLVSIFLALLILLSNTGLTFATHYCGGFAVKRQLMFGHHALDCGMANMDSDCENLPPEDDTLKSKSCCENHYQTLDTDDDYNSCEIQTIPNPDFIVAFAQTFLAISISAGNEKQQYTHYSPPLLEYDMPVMNQVFLL